MRGRFLFIVLTVAAVFLVGTAWNPGSSTSSSAFAQVEIDSAGYPEASNFYCPSVNNVASFNNRIHIRCGTANGSILYYAYATDSANVATANQMLAIGNTAFVVGRPVWFYYNASSSLNPPGCNAGDCRGLVGISMVF